MSKAVCYTAAFNAEDTLRRTVDSVLNQTHKDIIYYLCDNGSKDKTRDIIMDYAQKDSRIIPVLRDVNHLDPKGDGKNPLLTFITTTLADVHKKINADILFCLDADDEYKPDFLERMIAFLEENNLDIAACGNDFTDENTGVNYETRRISETLILYDEAFDICYPMYHAYMRTIWAKLYRIPLLIKCDYGNYKEIHETTNGADTMFCIRAYLHANRAGILAESLHRYYMTKQGVSRNFNSKRMASNRIVYNTQIAYLKEKTGNVSPLNQDFLFRIYFREVAGTVLLVMKSQMRDSEKLAILKDIFVNPQTRAMAMHSFIPGYTVSDQNEERDELFSAVSNWILSGIETHAGEGLEIASDILSVMGTVYTQSDAWSNAETFNLLVKIYKKAEFEAFKTKLERTITEVALRHPILAEVCRPGGTDAAAASEKAAAPFLIFFGEIIHRVLDDDLKTALDMLTAAVEEDREIPDGAGPPLVNLGLFISAELELDNYFVYYKKLQISLEIDEGLVEKAAAQLDEWLGLMPDDEDLKALSGRLDNKRLSCEE